MHRTCFLSLLAVVILGSACASSGTPGEARPKRNRNLITADELRTVAAASVYEVVRHLRPNWLRPRGRTGMPVVYRDDMRWGEDPRSLARLSTRNVKEIRFISASEASTRYGSGFKGVILVKTN